MSPEVALVIGTSIGLAGSVIGAVVQVINNSRTKESEEQIAGRKLKWHIWKTVIDNKTSYHYEALVRLEGGQWVWHIFMAAPDMQRIGELMSILKSYRARCVTRVRQTSH